MTTHITFRRRALIRALALAAIAAPTFALAQGDAFPSKPVRMILPFPAGGGADATARLLSQKLGEKWGQPVVVDNRPGANGSIGMAAAAKSAPDGYTLLLTDRGALGINPSLYRSLPYDPVKDYEFVGIATWSPYVLIAHPSLGASTFADFVKIAKAKPGAINYASFGTGSMAQMGMESLANRFGVKLTHVPYKGGGPAMNAAIAGEVNVTLISIAPVLGFVKDGRVKPLAVSGSKRLSTMPGVPTIVEAGGDEDTIPATYFGLAYPAGTPKAIVDRVRESVREVLAQPDVVEKLAALGFDAGQMSGDEMGAIVRRDVERFRKDVERLGIQPE